ncbi:MAG: phosphotransferase family protein [Solirubrobacteraceae bacterium]
MSAGTPPRAETIADPSADGGPYARLLSGPGTRQRFEDYLDDLGMPPGQLLLGEIGEGHSNLTFLVRRGGERLVLRRPPHGPLAPSANDVLREARVLGALRLAGARVAEVLAACESPEVIGAPFFTMSYIEGHVLTDAIPSEIAARNTPLRVSEEMVDTLAEVHAVDLEQAGLASLGRPDGYLERQLRRFNGLLERHATRPLPELDEVGDWLAQNVPQRQEPTLVHGDFRLGNLMFAPETPRVIAVFDWEMSTIGDPLADLGYATAMWAQADEPPNPLFDLSGVTRMPGFPTREWLAQRYERATGRSVQALPWYQVLAAWKAAIVLEGSYRRFREGASADPFFGRLDEGVPRLARLAISLRELA